MHQYISRKWTTDEYKFKCPDALAEGFLVFFRKFKKKIEGVGHNSTCVLFKSTFAGFTIIPFFILMGFFNQWTRLYLKLRSNCRCNCSLPMLTRGKIQTETHCEWPKVPRYPLHQHACSRFPLGIPWRPNSTLHNRLPTLSGKGCSGRLLASFTGSLNLIVSPLVDIICCWAL